MKRLLLTIIILLMAAFMVYIDEIYFKCPNIEKADTVRVVDTIRHVDTIVIGKTKPIYVNVVRVDTLYNNSGDSVLLFNESKIYKDTIACAGDSVEVTSYISGIKAQIDSMSVRLSRQEIIKTEYITNYITKPKAFIDHFKLGVGVGYGYGLNSKQFEPYIGINFSYNF